MKLNSKFYILNSIIYIFLLLVNPVSGFSAEVKESNVRNPKTNMNLVIMVRDKLKLHYVDKNVDEDELVYGAIRGMLESLDDPYTRFMPPKNFKEMKVRMAGQFFGVGIHIGMRKKKLTVISPINGTPAFKAGLKPNDHIVFIDGESTEGISLAEAVSKIRGPKGTTVVLGIERESQGQDKEIDVPIVRAKIEITVVDKVELFKDKVGYARLTTFENRKALNELKKAILKLKSQGAKSFILDLRFNGGGLLENAINMSGLFIDKGEIVHTIDRYGSKKTRSVNGRSIFEGPLIVLINEGSASASEILAGAIKDNDRGIIMGMNSFGKASVQNIMPLPDGSAVLYTIAKYQTPAGIDITKKGITVDVELKIPSENIEILQQEDYVYTFETDYQLQEAIKASLDQLAKK